MPIGSDISKNFNEKLREEYATIYQGLSSKFDRYPGVDDPIDIVSQIIEDFYNIPANIAKEDFSYERKRQRTNKIELPDIPTYAIRFAIEEGTWIVLLRDYFRSIIKDEFNRLLTLEDLIWNTDAHTTSDLGYYVIELIEITNKWILPLFSYWKKHHDYGRVEDFAVVIIGAHHQSSLNRAEMLYQGGIRLFTSKVEKLEKLRELKDTSTWFGRANDFIEIVEKESEERSITERHQYIGVIITLSLLQKELISYSKQQEQGKSDTGTTNTPWSDLDPTNTDHVENYKEYIVEQLYVNEEENPFLAGESIISSELEMYKIGKEKIAQTISKYNEIIEDIDNSEIYKLQEIIPDILIKLRKSEEKNKNEESQKGKLANHPLWNSLLDTYYRTKRITDFDIARNDLTKALKQAYLTIIDHRLLPEQAILKILENFDTELDSVEIDMDKTKSQIREIINNGTSLSNQELDQKLVEITVDELLRARTSDEKADDQEELIT